jgi:hypothetical protein
MLLLVCPQGRTGSIPRSLVKPQAIPREPVRPVTGSFVYGPSSRDSNGQILDRSPHRPFQGRAPDSALMRKHRARNSFQAICVGADETGLVSSNSQFLVIDLDPA